MDDQEREARGSSFGPVAAEYAAHRPGYPEDAVRWLVGKPPTRILELGAGTGKLTQAMSAIGHDVVATDPIPEMIDQLRTAAPKARAVIAKAEDIPLPSSSVDVVVAGQAFHWFDHERALPEIARVLKPGGVVSLVWNSGDLRVPWVDRVFRLIGHQSEGEGVDPFAGSDIFVLTEQTSIKHWQPFRLETLKGFVASSSYAATKDEHERRELLAEAARLYESYDRGPDGLLMPWIARCFRGRVAGLDRAAGVEGQERGPEDETVVISFP